MNNDNDIDFDINDVEIDLDEYDALNGDENEDSRVDADTSLADIDMERLKRFDVAANTARINVTDDNGPSMFAANNILRKTADNLEKAEALDDEKPLWTEKTAELEKIDDDE